MSASLGYCPPAIAGDIWLDLSKNEGREPRGLATARSSDADVQLARYPSLDDLRRSLAELYRVPADCLLVTAGGDDALLRLSLLACRPGSKAIVATPTFEMIRRYLALAGGDVCEVPWPAGAFPTDQVLSAACENTSIVFVVSPNNPTGAVASAADLRAVAEGLPNALVVLDAAYEEFADDGLTEFAQQFESVVVVRTLSKAWGLAGLRVGCAIARPDLLARLHASGNPMPVSVASADLAIRRLRSGAGDMADYVAQVCQQRLDLVAQLRRLGVQPAEPCQGNSVMARGVDAEWLTSALAALGIAVRRFPDQPDLKNAVRITLPGVASDFERLASAIETILAPQALLFDMDGVLADVTESYRRAIVATAESFGVEVSQQDIAAAKLRGNANDDWQLTRSLMQERGVDQSLADVVARFESFYVDLRARERLMVAADRLRSWRQRYRLAVVTGRPRDQAEHFIKQFGLDGVFEILVCREDAPAKPDPAPVRLAMQKLDVRAAWMLGDTVDDMRAARAAGVLPIGVGAGVPIELAACVLKATDYLEELL